MPKVVVLGSSGMLGRTVTKVLRDRGIQVKTAGRSPDDNFYLDVNAGDLSQLLEFLDERDYIVNAIGLITHRIDESNAADVANAFLINRDFPVALAAWAEQNGMRVIQIATDCVYDGHAGNYSEASEHNASDVYGISKSQGEVASPSVMHIRSSIVGPEKGRNLSLYEWVRSQPDGACLNGYSDHIWNGVTTYAFGRVVAGVVSRNLFKSGTAHLVPNDQVTKSQLVQLLADRAGRKDIVVADVATGKPINRTLITNDPSFNRSLWRAAGYEAIPSIADLIEEMPLN